MTLRDEATAIDSNYWKRPDKHDQRTIIIDYFNKSSRKDDVFNSLKTSQGSPSSASVIIDDSKSLLSLRMVRSEKGKIERRKSQKKGIDNTPFGKEYREMKVSQEQVTGAITGALNKDTLLGNIFKIRRLTPVECERLQGFPDGWTEFGYVQDAIVDWEPIYGWYDYEDEDGQIEERYGMIGKNPIDPINNTVRISDTQRYKCLGNAVTVPVITFLGHRIKESLFK